ncbi:unnamed protein product, partial [Prorocentrum cordatum]
MSAHEQMQLECPAWSSGSKHNADCKAEDVSEAVGTKDVARGPKSHKQEGTGAPMKLITLTARLLMSVTREATDISSTVFVHYVVSAGSALAAALVLTGKAHTEESQRLREPKQGGEDVYFKAG